MKALIQDNKVIQLKQNEFPVHASLTWMDAPEGCEVGWDLDNGELIEPVIPEKTNEQLLEEFENAINTTLAEKASEKNYDSELSIMSYATSTNLTWKAESLAYLAWRDAVWVYALDIKTQVEAEQMPIPDKATFEAGIPTMTWPA